MSVVCPALGPVTGSTARSHLVGLRETARRAGEGGQIRGSYLPAVGHHTCAVGHHVCLCVRAHAHTPCFTSEKKKKKNCHLGVSCQIRFDLYPKQIRKRTHGSGHFCVHDSSHIFTDSESQFQICILCTPCVLHRLELGWSQELLPAF